MIDAAKSLLSTELKKKTQLSQEIEDINKKIQELNNAGDFTSEEYISSTQALNKKTETLKKLDLLDKKVNAYQEAVKLSSDEEMAELANLEIEELKPEIENLTNDLEVLTATPLKNDEKKAIVEIRPGVGGVEASLFAEQLYRSYVRYCNTLGFKVEQYSLDYDQEGGIKEATFLIDSTDAFGTLRFESGVHRVQRVPVTESGGRIHTSTASIAILPKVEAKDIQIKDEELRIDVYRSSGPGGQSVNTTDSAVRITHLPTGLTVACQNGKSQHKNKEMAMSILLSKLSEIEEEKKQKEAKELRDAAILGGDRSAKIRTYNFPQSRVTDHRINQSWFNIDEIMEGNIDEIVKAVSKELRNRIGG